MHQRSSLQLQGVSTQQEASTGRTLQDQASRSSRLRRGSWHRCCCPPSGAPFWAWLLLGALVLPGAWSFLSEEQEELLVELHNHYRGQVSPSASAMLPLKWDSSLKVIAEGYAAKCVWNHNPELEDTGENLFAGTGPLDLREALEKWFLEHLDYDFNNNSCDEDKMCGHYTQMVWADTHRVGCAFHLCNSMEGLDWERVSFLVCNYYPAGNYEDERPYVEGDWCSRCPENMQKCENNLCVADTEEEEEEEEGTVDPSPDPSDPSLQPEEEEQEEQEQEEQEEQEEEAVLPPVTTDSYIQPVTFLFFPADTQPSTTPAPGTPPPEDPPTTLEQEEVEEEEVKERKEASEKMEGKGERDVTGTIFQDKKVILSAGSVSSPSLLLACLTVILTLRV